jgi:YidC/Oxa1 family membrane protein insertase
MLTAICFAMAAVLGWQYLMQYLAVKNHWTVTTQPTQAVQSATQPTEMPVPNANPVATPATRSASGLHVAAAPAAATQPDIVSIGSGVMNDPTYAIEMALSPRGAGVQRVAINQFKQTVNSSNAYTYEQPLIDGETTTDVLATDSVTLNDKTIDLSNVDWQLTQHTESSASFSTTISDAAGKPLARVEKTFEVFPKDDRRQGYESLVTERVVNLSAAPLTVHTMLNGTAPPLREMESSDDRQILAGYPQDNTIEPGHWMLSEFVKTPNRRLVVDEKTGQPMRWFGASSVYFLALVRPEPAGNGLVSMPVADAEAHELNADAPSDQDRMVATTLTTQDVTLKPMAEAELPLNVFFGPKKRSVISSDYYSAPPLCYDTTFRTTSRGFCGFCAFQPVITVLVDMLRAFHFVLRDWGLAIIALVALVRLCLHPITRRSTMSMQKMQKMGPEMEKLRAKYKDSPDELNKAMMQFYKEQGATPVLGCLPMFLQTPIWIALWQALQNTFELRHAPFLHPFGIPLTWINDLSKPDALVTFAHPILIPFLGWHLYSLNLLPLLMGVVMYMQQKLTPKPATMTPEQASQQKMMMVVSTAMFPLMLYTGPAGLNLYIFTSSGVGIWEAKVIRDHMKRREEAEKNGKVIVEGTHKMRRLGGGEITSKPEAPKGGIGGWFAKMQAMAEQVRREQEKKGKRK